MRVGTEEDVNRIAEGAIAAFGGFAWVNNARVSIFASCEEVIIADMKRMFDTNFWGTVYGSRAAVKRFRERAHSGNSPAGALINIGSFFGDRATPVQSTYCTSKHALHGWTDALRMELEAEKAPVSVTLAHTLPSTPPAICMWASRPSFLRCWAGWPPGSWTS